LKPNIRKQHTSGYTLTEISIGVGVLMIVGFIAYSMLMSSTTLFAKNVALNSSSAILRRTLDRIYFEINQANGMPKLINADGTDAAIPVGPAAGIIFDRYIGGPYIVTNPGATGLSATTQNFQMTCSTDALASPPIPKLNDVICLDNGTTRPIVSSCSVGSSGGLQTLDITLKAPMGKSVPWGPTVQETAYLVHRKAVVVVPVNGRAELRMYANAETVINYNDPASYFVLTRDIGGQTGENTPFAVVTQNGANFLSIAMRVASRQFDNYLAQKQAKEFNTFLRVDTLLRPRNFLPL
jgi:hypothetical protein